MNPRNLSTWLRAWVLSLLLVCVACASDSQDPLPEEPSGFDQANGVTGARLYDTFWLTLGWDASDPNLAAFQTYPEFFRCKSCHGWDRLGRGGAYVGRAPETSRPNVADIDLSDLLARTTPDELFEVLRRSTNRRTPSVDLSTYDPTTNAESGDRMPDFGSILTEDQTWDLVKFLLEEAIDTGALYSLTLDGVYPDGSATFDELGRTGNALAGDALYLQYCASCHDLDGTGIAIEGQYSVGEYVRDKPYEAQHRIRFGLLRSSMGPQLDDVDDLRNLFRAMDDAQKYPRL